MGIHLWGPSIGACFYFSEWGPFYTILQYSACAYHVLRNVISEYLHHDMNYIKKKAEQCHQI